MCNTKLEATPALWQIPSLHFKCRLDNLMCTYIMWRGLLPSLYCYLFFLTVQKGLLFFIFKELFAKERLCFCLFLFSFKVFMTLKEKFFELWKKPCWQIWGAKFPHNKRFNRKHIFIVIEVIKEAICIWKSCPKRQCLFIWTSNIFCLC